MCEKFQEIDAKSSLSTINQAQLSFQREKPDLRRSVSGFFRMFFRIVSTSRFRLRTISKDKHFFVSFLSMEF